jgi:tetratricopeptide (TPR) repeat protein
LSACGAGNKPRTATAADFSTLVGAGNDLLRAGNPQAAEQLFARAVDKNGDSAVAHYDLGVAYQDPGLTRQAMIEYERAVKVDPRFVPALYNQAVILAKHDRPLAIYRYRHVIRLLADSPTAFLNLGLLEWATDPTGGRAAAIRDIGRAIRLDPSLRANLPATLKAGVHA